MLSNGIYGHLYRLSVSLVLTVSFVGGAFGQDVPSTSQSETEALLKARQEGQVLQRAEEMATSSDRARSLQAEAEKNERAKVL